jgi:hypothetical protein
VKRSISPDIRTARVARSKGEWIRLSQCVKGGFGTTVSLYRNGETMSYYVYLGPLGQVVRHEASFTASKDGFPIGTYDTFREAMEALAWKGRVKAA